jgi:hypothetical protein
VILDISLLIASGLPPVSTREIYTADEIREMIFLMMKNGSVFSLFLCG